MGFCREISKGPKFVPRAGVAGGRGRYTSQQARLWRPLDPDTGKNTGFSTWWERDGFVAQGLVSSIQSKRKVLACPRWSPRSLGLGQLGAEGEHDCCFYTAKLGVSILRSLSKGVGAFPLVLQLELRSAASSPPQP